MKGEKDMLMKVVGVQEQDYKMDNGYSFKGRKIHAVDLETKSNGLVGNVVTTFKIPSDSALSNVRIEIGSVYKCYFTQKGALDDMVLSSQPPADQFDFMDDLGVGKKK